MRNIYIFWDSIEFSFIVAIVGIISIFPLQQYVIQLGPALINTKQRSIQEVLRNIRNASTRIREGVELKSEIVIKIGF